MPANETDNAQKTQFAAIMFSLLEIQNQGSRCCRSFGRSNTGSGDMFCRCLERRKHKSHVTLATAFLI